MIALALLAQAAPAPFPAAIAPIADRAYRLTREELWDEGAVRHRFVQTMMLTFHREGGGWRVDTLIDSLTAQPADDAGARFVRGNAPLKGRTLRFHLDPAGHVVALDDEDGAWAAVITGVAAMADDRPGQPIALARDPAAPLRALPREAHLALIAGDLTAAVPSRAPVGTAR